MSRLRWFIIAAGGLLLYGLGSHCHPDLDGAQLAEKHCSSCHLYTPPEVLDRATWQESVLPQMGLRLGIREANQDPYAAFSPAERSLVEKANIYPSQAQLSQKDWQKIVDFYLAQAPAQLPASLNRPLAVDTLPLFSQQDIQLNTRGGPLTCLLAFDSLRQEIILGDGRNQLYFLNSDGQVKRKLKTASSPVGIFPARDGGYKILNIGYFHPNDLPRGQLVAVAPDGTQQTLLQDLPRPVAATQTDLNEDGLVDFVLCGYGNQIGRFSWWEQKDAATYQEHILMPMPGAIQTELSDLNADGRLDILVLFAQGNEQLIVFYNEGQGQFRPEVLLRFHAAMGSNSFALHDFNQDGHLDILYTNGDNADYSIVPKNYHGLRIFQNNGQNEFKETFHFPIYGASKAIARDFDLDGDLDLATIAFFAEYEKAPQEGFIYLENQNGTFKSAHTFQNSKAGRWLVMEATDIDADGDEDILLGAFSFAASKVPDALQKQWKQSGVNGVILKNNSR